MNVLVVDVGGSHVKLLATGEAAPRRFDSGKKLTPAALVAGVGRAAAGWAYEVVSLGVPGAVGPNGPEADPGNLGKGWVGFDYPAAFDCPVRVVNDAAMQALGAYTGGRMLFLGLGTGLGSSLVTDRVVIPLELGCLPFGRRESMADRIGKRGLARYGEPAWQAAVTEIVLRLRDALSADYVVIGGGNARRVKPLPAHTRRGGNEDAFAGGFRLWEEEVDPHALPAAAAWRVVR